MSMLVSLGDLVLDLLVTVQLPIQAMHHQDTQSVEPEPGGSGNFMILGARLGAQIASIGALGDDLFGKFLLEVFQAEGIDCSGIGVMPASRSTLVLDLIDSQQGQHVFIGTAAQGTLLEYSPPMQALMAQAGALFMQGYTLHEAQLRQLVPQVIASAHQHAIPVYFDVGPTVGTLAHDWLEAALNSADILMMTEDEVPLAAQGKTGDSAYADLLARRAHLLVIKQGAQGCTLVTAQGKTPVAGFSVPVVDTIGAGDCFDAAFIHARLRGWDWADCARFANLIGAANVQKRGAGRKVPTRDEVRALAEQVGYAQALSLL